MNKSCSPGLPMVPLCIIGEARTHDNGKLLFKIATEDGEALLLIKIKGIKEEYTYDALGRVATRVAECGVTEGKLTSTYGYVAGGYGTNSTTPLVASIAQEGVAFSYAYDNRGNITSDTRNGLTTTYVYDALGQLVRVNDPNDITAGETGTTTAAAT